MTASIIITTYNSGKYLTECLNSAINQKCDNYDVIIVDGNSTDSTKEIILSLKNKKINFYNLGYPNRSAQLNKAIELSGSKYIMILDSDDIASPERLYVQVDYLEKNPGTGIVGSYAHLIYEDGGATKKLKRPLTHAKIIRYLLSMNAISFPTITFKKDIFNKYKFDESLEVSEDLEWFIRISENYIFANIPQYLTDLRQSINSRSRNKNTSYKNFFEVTSKTISARLNRHQDDKNLQYRLLFYLGCLNYYYGDLTNAKEYFSKAAGINFFDPLLWRYLVPLKIFKYESIKNFRENRLFQSIGKMFRFIQNSF